MHQNWRSSADDALRDDEDTIPIPKFVRKMQRDKASVELRVEPSPGRYDDQFRFYWLICAWVLLGFQGLAMIVLLLNMAGAGGTYLWLPHAIGTAIIIPAFALTACVYRFILFPTPQYVNVTPEDFVGYGYAPDAPPPTTPPPSMNN